MEKTASLLSICQELINKFYQLSLKLEDLEERGREYGYESMSGLKYKEGFEGKEDLYEHTIEIANDIFSLEEPNEVKLEMIIKEVRTLVRNEISPKIIATFLNSSLRLSGLSNKFLFYVEEVAEIEFDEKYNEENNFVVASWMNRILDKVLAK